MLAKDTNIWPILNFVGPLSSLKPSLALFWCPKKGNSHFVYLRKESGVDVVVARDFKEVETSVMSKQRAEAGQWRGFIA